MRTAVVTLVLALAFGCGDDAPSESADGATDGETSMGDSSVDEGEAGAHEDSGVDAGEAPHDAGQMDAGDGDAGDGDAGDGDAGTLPDPISVETFCEGLADSLCDWLNRCRSQIDCTKWPRWAGIVGSCEAAQAALAAGRVDYDGVYAARCVAAHQEMSCAGAPPIVTAQVNPAVVEGDGLSCTRVFSGRIEEGLDCYTNNTIIGDECVSGSACYREGRVCPGHCEALGELDDDCATDLGLQCEPDLLCQDGACAARPGQGEDCSSSGNCIDGLVCVRVDAEQEIYECHARAANVGDACEAFAACPAGASCFEGTCRDALPTAAPCIAESQCPADELCTSSATGDGTQRCRPRIESGEPCGYTEQCVAPLVCFQAGEESQPTCRAYAAVDDPCSGGWCAEGLFCSFGASPVCKVQGVDSDPCEGEHDACAGALLCMSDSMCHPRGGLDAPCDIARAGSCADGFFCDLSSATCALPRPESGLCSPGEPSDSCAVGFYCDCVDQQAEGWCPDGYGTPPSGTYACVAQAANGAACTVDHECESGNCAFNLKQCAPVDVGDGFAGCVGP